MQWSTSWPGNHPCGFLSMYFCLEVEEFGSGMSKWWQPAVLRQQRCMNYHVIKSQSKWQALFLRHYHGHLLFCLLEFDCWSAPHYVHCFIQNFRGRGRAHECPSLLFWFWLKSKISWHLFSSSGWAVVQVDGNVVNSWSWSNDCENTP